MRAQGRAWVVMAGALMVALVAGCGDSTTEPGVPIAELQGEYETTALRFDPQGAVAEVDILEALAATGRVPSLNIDLVGSFQIFYRDPVTGSIRTLGGNARTTVDGIQLTFSSRQMADEFLLPQTIPLVWDPTTETLSFSAAADLSRDRLVQLFPELAEEQLLDPSPGILTVEFQKASAPPAEE